MLYTVICRDKPDHGDLRAKTRPDHLSYMRGAADRLKFAGPLLSEDADPQPIGSLIILDAASVDAVRVFANNDPYARAGLFQSVEITPVRGVMGAWHEADKSTP